MADTLSKIKTYTSVNLDNFEIRGSRMGINNANTTGPLYVDGVFNNPYKSVLTGTATASSGDSTVVNVALYPFTTANLVVGDNLIVGPNASSKINGILSYSSVTVKPAPVNSGTFDATATLIDREYLIEPDIVNNTTRGLANFVGGSTDVTGIGTLWSSTLRAGDVIQLNTLQQYFTISQVNSNTSIRLTQPFPLTATGENFTTKRWRLDWMDYEYTKNNFTYNKNKAKWIYDATTADGFTATSYWNGFVDGIQLKFSPSLTPATSPDLMDSNLVLEKVLTQSTENDMPQYSLPVVPIPEESLSLYIDGVLKDRFPDGNMDYVINYSQMPTYQYPPPVDQRTVANIMFLSKIQNIALNHSETATGTLIFRDGAGNQLAGIMPGSESILFDGTRQSINEDYVLNIDAGIGYASEHITNEAVVKYVAYQKTSLYDYGLSITLNGVPQKLTIPHSETDDVIFDTESGRMKPATKDNPGPGDEYIVEYYAEGSYVSNLTLTVAPGQTTFRLPNAIKYQSLIIIKNDVFLTEWEDYRVGYLTGRVVLFVPIVIGDVIVVNYSPMIYQKNGLTYENQAWYCKSYAVTSPVASISSLVVTLTNSNLSSPVILNAYNATKGKTYDLTGYVLNGTSLQLQLNATNIAVGTELTDVVQIDYKFQSDSVEYIPVTLINFFVGQGSNYIAFINQDVRSTFLTGTFIRLTNVDSAGDYFFRVSSSVYDGEDTVVNIDGTIPEDITNPIIYVSDSSLNFTSAPVSASPIQSGATDFYFPGDNYSEDFRVGSLLNIENDYYYINNSQYDSSALRTVVSVAVKAYADYTDSAYLGAVRYSDCPLYYVGDTVISTAKPFITDPVTPAMSLNYNGLTTVTANSSSLNVYTDSSTYSFSYVSHKKLSDLSSAMSVIPGLQVTNYCPDWTSSKIIPVTKLTVTVDSSSVIAINPSLRYQGTDTTKYSFTNGLLTLSNPLVINDRYDLDYLGQKPLYDTTVSFSASYFSVLPAKSKIEASFKFDNLDQFYIQATSQRSFLDDVIIPQKKQEALQQSGSIGQGGELPDDGEMLNPDGGLTGDEYRRMDMAIECRIFKNIFDFYNDRAQAFGDEMYSAFGWKLCNNDGLINSVDDSCGTRSINRMFPWADYTEFPPYKITPLTGQSIPYAEMGPSHPPSLPTAKAQFTYNSATVVSTTPSTYPTYWLSQLKPGDYIRPYGSSTDSTIFLVNNDSQVTLTLPYTGSSRNSAFVMTSRYPLYDDDGHTGAKIVGTVSDGFGLDNSDVFNVTVDGSHQVYTFLNPSDPFLAQLYPVSSLSAGTIAGLITSAFPRTKMTYEWVQDINSPYGYKTVFVLRTKDGYNEMSTGHGNAVPKLMGIDRTDSTAIGNINNTDSQPEYYADTSESSDLGNETTRLATLISAGIPNKIDRVTPSNITLGTEIHNYATDEALQIAIEIDRLNTEIAATSHILLEPDMASYAPTLIAHNNDTTYAATCPYPLLYDQSIATDYQGRFTAARWILNLAQWQNTILGKDSTGMGVPVSSGIGITPIIGETTFFIHVDGDGTNDRRILNTTVDNTSFLPYVTFMDSGAIADGTWNGTWEPSVGNQYSTTANDATFVLSDATASFVMKYGAVNFYCRTDVTSLSMFWFGSNRKREYLYSVYPTVGSLKTELNKLAGIDASGNVSFNGRPSSGILSMPISQLLPGVTISDSTYSLFDIMDDGIYNISYFINKTGLGLSWDGDSTFYNYTPGMTVGSIKNDINKDVPGLDATGNNEFDSSSVGFKITSTTAIPPDASVLPSLRDCYANYYTIDDKYLFDRQTFVLSRKPVVDARISYLNTRDLQIKQHIIDEEYFRSIDSSTGNLYNWADNRFNRSVGCEAKLKQIEKQIEMSQSSLNVSRRFL